MQRLPGADAAKTTNQAAGDVIQYTLALNKHLDKTLPIGLAIPAAIDVDFQANANVSIDVHLAVTFGVNKRTRQFFIVESIVPQLSASAQIDADLDNLATQLGFLGLSINNGAAQLAGNLTLGLLDAGGADPDPGIITADELTAGRLANLVDLHASGNAGVSLPLTASLGNLNKTETLSIHWSDITNPGTLAVDTAQIQDFLKFDHTITIQEVLAGLQALPGLLRKLAGSGGLGVDLPVVGSNLRQSVLDLADQIDAGLAAIAPFTTAQGLQQSLQNLFNNHGVPVDVNVTGSDVKFTPHFSKDVAGKALRRPARSRHGRS